MTRRVLIVLLPLVGIAGVVVFLHHSRSCLATLSRDAHALRPRSWVIMNPLRDRAPERLAETYVNPRPTPSGGVGWFGDSLGRV